jgi:hypothetical protein
MQQQLTGFTSSIQPSSLKPGQPLWGSRSVWVAGPSSSALSESCVVVSGSDTCCWIEEAAVLQTSHTGNPRPLATVYSANLNMAASILPTASRSSIWLPGHGLDRNSHLALCQTLSQHRTSFIPELNENKDDPLSFRDRHRDTTQACIPYSSTRTLPRVKFSSLNTRSHWKKKKLVISGVGASDTQKFEGIKRWCEVYL